MEPLYIIKIGGNVIDDEAKLSSFLLLFSKLKGAKILIHGGGKLATRMATQLNIPQQMIEGRRVTDAETLKVITMVYAGYINKMIVAKLQSTGCNALGLTGADGNSIHAHRRIAGTIDYGFAGDIDGINSVWLKELLTQNISLVFAPVTHDKNGQLLNTNADTVATELAKSLAKDFDVSLVFTFEKIGVLTDADDELTVVSKIDPPLYNELKAQGKIFAGMIPKLDNAFTALNSGVKKVIIGKAENLHQLIKGISGTSITNE
jgi:acetylglutamate kinase